MLKNNAVLRNMILCMLIVLLIIIGYSAIYTKNFHYEFQVIKNDSTDDVEKVIFEGRFIRFPLAKGYIEGTITIGDKEYTMTKYNKKHSPNESHSIAFYIYFIDKKKGGFLHGKALLYGNILDGNVKSTYITIDIMDSVSGYSYTETIYGTITK